MELNRKHIAIVLVVLFLCSVGAVGVAIAQTPSSSSSLKSTSTSAPAAAGSGQFAPVNPEWTQYVNNQAVGRVATQTSDGKGLGLIPSPVDLSQVNAGKGSEYAGTYPASYDLRTYGKVSPVGDQGGCGSCWTFATYGSLESYLRPASYSFSEKALNNKNGFSKGCCQGGNWLMSTAYLTRWGTTMKYYGGGTIYAGPVTTACDPYTTPYCTDAKTCSIAKHVQKVVMFPKRTSALDNNAIKYGLTHYGALYVAFLWDPHYYNDITAAYWCNGPITGGNHGVTIVGWDNNFPKTRFSTWAPPPGNGAFIVKNSWGKSWGNNGYFYVSYYDKNFGSARSNNAVAFTAESTTNYKTNYQYDPFGWVNNFGYGSTTAWGANVFTAKAGSLKAVGLYAPAKNTAYTIYVYKNPSSTNPKSGTLVATKSGTVTYAGYYTASIPSVSLIAGQKFSVVIKYTTPGYTYPLSVTMFNSGYVEKIPYSVKGHSFGSKTGTAGTWEDFAVRYGTSSGVANCIHAYAS